MSGFQTGPDGRPQIVPGKPSCVFCGDAGWTWETDLYGEAVKEPCFRCDAFDKRVAAQAPIVNKPVLPYAGTSGWSGSTTSRERAERDDRQGKTTERQNIVLRALANVAEHGATWKELGEAFGWHHGQASGTLSVLHKAGKVARLKNRRARCEVYVLPQFVMDRETSPYRANSKKEHTCTACGHKEVV